MNKNPLQDLIDADPVRQQYRWKNTEEPVTIYAVNSGSYSDYRICGLFSSEANARKHMEAYPDDEYNDLETWVLDKGISELDSGLVHYWVQMNADGKISRVEPRNPREWWGNNLNDRWLGIAKKFFNTHCWAKDETHAIKIANERRIMMLATPPAPPPEAPALQESSGGGQTATPSTSPDDPASPTSPAPSRDRSD